MCIMIYRRRLYIFAIDKRNHLKIYMFGVVGETRAHDSFELIWFVAKETKQGNEKLQRMLLCHFKTSFK